MTTLFIGGNKKKLESPIYQSFNEGDLIQVPARGIIFVPGKIMAAVCFPKCQVENRFPHMTLLLGKWPAKNSNMALEQTAASEDLPFYALYQ